MIDPALFASLPLLADGGVGDALRRRHPDWRGPVEALNQSRPEAVQALHAEYAAAGARLLRTNTAGANAAALALHGLDERAEALNNSGSALARQAQAPPGLVMGTLGPPPTPEGWADPAWERGVAEQAIYLSDTGVELFLLEHFPRLDAAEALTRRLKGLSDAPVLAALQFGPDARTADGPDAVAAADVLGAAGADALGLCCGPGAAALPQCLPPLLASGLPVAVLAGVHAPGAAPPYPGAPALGPDAFADWLAALAGHGVAILGGCCGVEPAHVRALARALGRDPVAADERG